MQECDVCGLLFGGTDECPSCGSRTSHVAEEEISGQETPAPAGPLPGKSALDEAKAGMKGLDLGLAIELPKTSTTSLPFQVGGVGQVASSLPFGVGAPSGVISDDSDEEIPALESQPSVEVPVVEAPVAEIPVVEAPVVEAPVVEAPVVETPVVEEPIQSIPETTVEITSNDDPWAVSEPKPIPMLEAIPESNDSIDDEPPMLVLQARPIMAEEEQLSESPVLVENAFEIHAEELNSEHVYAIEDDIIVHDFGDELQVSEVIVNFDELVDPADQTIRFDHELLSEGEPELMPAKALPINDGGDARIAGHSIAAFEALAEGRWEDAADGFRIVCNELPGDPAALNDFGLALRQIAMEVHETNPTPTPAEEPHFEAAVLALRQAAQQDRHNPTILYNLATCLATCGRHGVATRIWDATITLSPQDPAPLNGKAVSLIAQGEFDAASALLMRAREIAPSESIILRNLRRLRPTA